jgi:hypothetical protein
VGVRIDNEFVEYGCVIKTLRWVAYESFAYDPDHYFADGSHDQFGFVEHRRFGAIII